MQKALGRGESMVVEFGCVAAVSEACKIVAEERNGLGREPPYTEGFAVKITGERALFGSKQLHALRTVAVGAVIGTVPTTWSPYR